MAPPSGERILLLPWRHGRGPGWLEVNFLFFQNDFICRVLRPVLGEPTMPSPSARQRTLDEAFFAEYLYVEWAAPSATLGEVFAECF